MIGHDQEAAVEHALLTGEHARHRRLHIIVDTAPGHAAKESERPSMSIEQHLLALTRIGPDVRRARCAETSVRNLYPHRLAGDLYILVAPVELISLARLEGHRDEGRSTFARILPARPKIGRASWRERVGPYV